MTPTEQARRSDSLYYGEITRRELCNLVAHMEADIEEERRAYDHLMKVAAHAMRGTGEGVDDGQGCPDKVE